MSIDDIKKMTVAERVYLMEQIWNTLNQETKEIDSPFWHKELLEERKKAIKKGDVKMYTPAELKSKLLDLRSKPLSNYQKLQNRNQNN